jgi:hypothetical protein
MGVCGSAPPPQPHRAIAALLGRFLPRLGPLVATQKPADTGTVYNDSMTTQHLLHQLTTSHLSDALKPSEKPKPVPTAGSNDAAGSNDKGSAPISESKEK